MTSGPYVARPGTVIQSTVDARWAETVLESHNQRRRLNGLVEPGSPVYHSPYDQSPETALPPALQETGDRPPSSTPDRRSRRFRDGLPPPPPPPPPITEREVKAVLAAAGLDPEDLRSVDAYAQAVQQGRLPPLDEARTMLGLARRRSNRLRSQAEMDLDTDRDARRSDLQNRRRANQRDVLRPDGRSDTSLVRRDSLVPGDLLTLSPGPSQRPVFAMAQSRPLTPSQKRRLRRRRSREAQGDVSILQPASPTTNGHRPTPNPEDPSPTDGPEPTGPPTPRTCGHTSRVYLPGITQPQWIELACSLDLRPHPGQPHLVSVPVAYLDGASELFIGWFGPGE